MSWKGVPKKENYFPLFAEDWNTLVDAVDDLYYMLQRVPQTIPPAGPFLQGYVAGDLVPLLDAYYNLGSANLRFNQAWVKTLYVEDPLKVEYMDQLLQYVQEIKLTLDSVSAIVNSALARDLWETYPLEIQFQYPDGVLEVFRPPKYYQTIVRGWYSVSTAASGLGRLRGAVSLKPIGLIPLSETQIQVNDVFIPLYYDEPLLLYYSNADIGSYLSLLLNVLLQLTTGTVRNASGLDPDDPAWAPPDGWTKVWEFKSPSELDDAFTTISYVSVANDQLLFNPPSGKTAYVDQDISGIYYKKVAICLKMQEYNVSGLNVILLEVVSDKANVGGIYADVFVTKDSPQLLLLDDVSNNQIVVPIPQDWFVIVAEYTEPSGGYLRVYDSNKRLIAELPLGNDLWNSTVVYLAMWNGKNTTNGTYIFSVDWIAVKY
jgi:hypothetical protein